MKKFVFTLQRLRDVKEMQEKQKRVELEELLRNLEIYQRQRDANQKLFDRQYQAFESKCVAGLGMIEAKQYNEFLQYLEKEMRTQDTVIASCQSSIDLCRAQLLKLINESNVLDRMKEEQYRKYLKEVQKNDDRMIEDFMQARF